MKLKLKLLAAALGFALAGGANAAITNSASGNGELFFTIWDTGADLVSKDDDRAYVRDLGTLANGSLAGGTLSDWASVATSPSATLNPNMLLPGTPGFNVAADANLTSFLVGSSDLSRLRWNIAATDSVSTDRFLTTATGIASSEIPTYTEFRVFATRTDTYLAPVNAGLGSNESVVLTGTNASISLWGSNVGGQARFNTAGSIGDSLNFFLLSEKATTGTVTKATVQQFEQWTLGNDGTLVYAVPEPGTWAMLAAGLLMIGGIARRRLS